MNDLLQIRFTLPEDQTDACQAFLAENVPHGWQEEQPTPDTVTYCLFVEDTAAGRALAKAVAERWPQAEVMAEEREEEDWGRAWMEFFVPLECGQRFEILPPWLADKAKAGLTPVIIEPKMAFGTGHHPTRPSAWRAWPRFSVTAMAGKASISWTWAQVRASWPSPCASSA